jgi:hypothetical protein
MAPPLTLERLHTALRYMIELAAAYERRGSRVDSDSEKIITDIVNRLAPRREKITEKNRRSASVRLVKDFEELYREKRKRKVDTTEEEVKSILESYLARPSQQMIQAASLTYGQIASDNGPHNAAVKVVSQIIGFAIRTIDYRIQKDGDGFIPTAFGVSISPRGLITYVLEKLGLKPAIAKDLGFLIERLDCLENEDHKRQLISEFIGTVNEVHRNTRKNKK